MDKHLLAFLALIAGTLAGTLKCQPDSYGVRRYNGKPCASTTRYNDKHRGACGCGPENKDTPYDWNLRYSMVSVNQAYFDEGGDNHMCGSKCGTCVKLTPTGGYIRGYGTKPNNTDPHIFMITNECLRADNPQWCGQTGEPGTNTTNYFGFEAHFDLQDSRNQVTNRGWINPEVTYEEVKCNADFYHNWVHCECH